MILLINILEYDYAIEKWDMDYFNPETEGIKPNSMQRRVLKELRRIEI